MFLKQYRKPYQKSSKIRLVLVPEIGVIRGKHGYIKGINDKLNSQNSQNISTHMFYHLRNPLKLFIIIVVYVFSFFTGRDDNSTNNMPKI